MSGKPETKDFVGNPITPGCHLVYPVRQGSSMYLRLMRVVEITLRRITGHDKDGRRVHIQYPERSVVVRLPDAIPANQEPETLQGMEG